MHISNLKIYKNPYTINDDGFISFKDRKSYERYLSKYLKDPIGRGAQGTAYLTTDEGIIYPTHCELGKVYSPEECEKLGILT